MKRITIYLTISIFFLSCDPSKDGLDPIDTGNTITTQGLDFIPDLINCDLGDTIFFELTPSYNVFKLVKTYQNNGGTPLDGGFNIDYGQSGYFCSSIYRNLLLLCVTTSSWNEGRIIVQ